MVNTITREELQRKINSDDDFVLVETLPEQIFGHAHLPKAANLPPDRVKELAGRVLPINHQKSSFTIRVSPETLQRTPPMN